jgi:hypothetical protein
LTCGFKLRTGKLTDWLQQTEPRFSDGSTANFVTGKAVFWLQSNGLIRTVREANPPNMSLDVALAPHLAADKTQSQFPGGTGAALGLYHKVDDSRRLVWRQ